MNIELKDIVEALKELETIVFIQHYGKTIAVIEEKTKIKDFEIIKNTNKKEITLKFKDIDNEDEQEDYI